MPGMRDAGRLRDAGGSETDARVPDGGRELDSGTDAGAPLPAACVPRAVCPECPAGESCGGGGVAHECGSRACTHHVSPTAAAGTTFDACTSAETPCTLAAANAGARPGDVVCLAGGTYVGTAIAPAESGTAEAPIVFRAADASMPPVIRGVTSAILLQDVSFVEVDGVHVLGEGLTGMRRVTRFFRFANADDCWIRNSTFRDAFAYVGSEVDVASARNRITGNTFEDAPGPPFTADLDAETWPADSVEIRGDRTVLEGNWFGDVSHIPVNVWVDRGHTTVVRDNFIRNRLHAGVVLFSVEGATGRTLVEGNRIHDSGALFETNPNSYSRTHTTRRDDSMARGRQVSMQIVSTGVIFRRNDVAGGGRGLWITGYMNATIGAAIYTRNARLAHNTFAENLTSVVMANDLFMTHPFANLVIQNNLFRAPVLREVHIDSSTPDAQQFFSNGWTPMETFRLFSFTTERSLAETEAAQAPSWAGNVSIDPAFVDEAGRDYRLGEGSPAIDAASFLTTIEEATPVEGGTTLRVADAWWFYDGWDIPGEVGDLVMTESGAVARVTDADVAARTVTVSPAITITPGEGLTFAYTGSAPDLGAHERCPR